VKDITIRDTTFELRDEEEVLVTSEYDPSCVTLSDTHKGYILTLRSCLDPDTREHMPVVPVTDTYARWYFSKDELQELTDKLIEVCGITFHTV
jgi:hypothetical protein